MDVDGDFVPDSVADLICAPWHGENPNVFSFTFSSIVYIAAHATNNFSTVSLDIRITHGVCALAGIQNDVS